VLGLKKHILPVELEPKTVNYCIKDSMAMPLPRRTQAIDVVNIGVIDESESRY